MIIRPPGDAPIRKNFSNHAAQGAFEGFNAVAGFEVGGFSQRDDALDNRLAIQHPGDIMRRERSRFPAASTREFREQRVRQSAGNFGKGVAVEEKEGRLAMERAQPV